MNVRVETEFTRLLPPEALNTIGEFNSLLKRNPEEIRRTLARKAFAKSGENPELDTAIERLLNAGQAKLEVDPETGKEVETGRRLLTLGFNPAEFTWGEIWRDPNYKNALSDQARIESEINSLKDMPALNAQAEDIRAESIEDRIAELSNIRRRRRIIALGVAAHLNTSRYEGPKKPLNFVIPGDLSMAEAA